MVPGAGMITGAWCLVWVWWLMGVGQGGGDDMQGSSPRITP